MSEIIFAMTWLLRKKKILLSYIKTCYTKKTKNPFDISNPAKYKQQLLSNSEPVYTDILWQVHIEQNSFFIMRNETTYLEQNIEIISLALKKIERSSQGAIKSIRHLNRLHTTSAIQKVLKPYVSYFRAVFLTDISNPLTSGSCFKHASYTCKSQTNSSLTLG